ncbi:MAG: DUF664 domain-containing protein [Gordonia sp. (in: high G+C Gram-positive bacteria)]
MSGLYTPVTVPADVTGEKADLLAVLADQRNLFRVTLRDITDDQARSRTTVSELTLGGLLKHLAWGERHSATIISECDEHAELDMAALAHAYDLLPAESLAYWLTEFDEGAAAFDAMIAGIDDLDARIPQPTAPWAPERSWLTVRGMVLNKIRETAHHCGHADIIREALDGQTTMAALAEGQDWEF